MAFSFENLNRSKKTMKENINLDSMSFVNIKDFIGQELPVDGFFFTTSKFGEQVVICSGDKKVNIPSRYADTFKQIRDDDEALKALLDGHLALTNIHALDSKNGKTTAFDFKTV